MVTCPICSQPVRERDINAHIDSQCKTHIEQSQPLSQGSQSGSAPVSSFFTSISSRRQSKIPSSPVQAPAADLRVHTQHHPPTSPTHPFSSKKRKAEEDLAEAETEAEAGADTQTTPHTSSTPHRQPKENARPRQVSAKAPLAERMRPQTLDDVCGQDLVGQSGILRGLIEQGRVPSLVLWGPPGTGKTTIARLVALESGMRFVEINSSSAGVAECKKIFQMAKNEQSLTGKKTLLFCDEIHRFSKTQQDVFLAPVESGTVTLIGATTENPSFKIGNALLSRCRVFTLSKLSDEDIKSILKRALQTDPTAIAKGSGDSLSQSSTDTAHPSAPTASSAGASLITDDLLEYIAAFSAGDARTSLNLLELAISLDKSAGITAESLKKSLTQTLLYDRASDGHYDTISALHKSVRGSDPDAALFYLARMLTAGEDPLFIARRLIVIASEDVGLADNTMLPLAIATHSAVEKIGMPEARINLAHTVTALALAPKSTRAYRGLNAAMAAIENFMGGREGQEGVGEKRVKSAASLDVPLHLRMGVTRLMREMGCSVGYKYNPDYLDGRVEQEYLPEGLRGQRFLDDIDLGTKIDPDLEDEFDHMEQ